MASGKNLTITGGGTVNLLAYDINGSNVSFIAGSLNYAGNLFVGTGGVLGNNLALDSTRQLSLTGLTNVDVTRTLALTGGALHTGSPTNNGTLSLSSGTLNTATATFASGSTLAIVVSGTTRLSQYGALVASGAVNLAGSLVVTLNNFTPALGNSFDILDGSISGPFSSLQLPALSAGLGWNTSALYTTGVLSVVAAAGVPGDYNGNGTVDAADYAIWRETLGSTTDLRANGDNSGASAGKIDQADFVVWKANFGMHAGSGASAGPSAAVPEPSTAWILLVGIVAMCARRRATVLCFQHESRVRNT